MEKVQVVIESPDQLTRIGLTGAIRMGDKADVVGHENLGRAQVLLHATNRFNPATAPRLRQQAIQLDVPIVLVVDELDDSDLLTAVGCGVVAVLLRPTISIERLTEYVVCAAGGHAAIPSDMLGDLFGQVRNLRHDLTEQRATNRLGLAQREIDVLRLLAEGHDTTEISKKLAYSERTIKNVISSVLTRLGLRNRTHAVASAMRSGLF